MTCCLLLHCDAVQPSAALLPTAELKLLKPVEYFISQSHSRGRMYDTYMRNIVHANGSSGCFCFPVNTTGAFVAGILSP